MKTFTLISVILFSLVFMLNSTYAQETQLELLKYQFEEGSGSIVLDSSGNNFHATNIGANYDTTQATFGIYAMDFDGNGDYLTTISGSNIPEKLAFSFWADMDGNPQTTLLNIFGTNDNFKILLDSDGASNVEWQYNDIGAVPRTQTLSNNPFLINTMYHIVLNFDFVNQTFNVYRNGVLDGNGNINFQVSREDGTNTLRIGANDLGANEFDGDVDEYRMFFGNLNLSQIQSLHTSNTVQLYQPIPDINITDEEPLVIINSLFPGNGTFTNPMNFQAILNVSASCDLYVDNNLEESFEEVVSFNTYKILNLGLHTYFIYCETIENGTKYFEFSETYDIEILIPDSTLSLNIIAKDYDSNEVQLYLTSPCLEKGLVVGDSEAYRSSANLGGAYFKPVENNIVSMVLPSGVHEFCLLNGIVNFDTYNKTSNYHVINAEGNLKLGDFELPNNITTSYTITVEQFDIYDKINPKAWGESWVSIIASLIAIALGALLVFAGVSTKAPAAVVIGGLLLLMGLGYQINNLVFGVLM